MLKSSMLAFGLLCALLVTGALAQSRPLTPAEEAILKPIVDALNGPSPGSNPFGTIETPGGGPFTGTAPVFRLVAEDRLAFADPFGDQRPFEGADLGEQLISLLPPTNDYFVNSSLMGIVAVEVSAPVSNCGATEYRELALFMTQPGLPTVGPNPNVPNDPGVGSTEAVALICIHGATRQFFGLADGVSLVEYGVPYPTFEIEAEGRHFVVFVVANPTIPGQVVTSFASNTSDPAQFGFQRGALVGFGDVLPFPPGGLLTEDELTRITGALGMAGAGAVESPTAPGTAVPADTATPTGENAQSGGTEDASPTPAPGGAGGSATTDTPAPDGNGGSNGGLVAAVVAILAAGAGGTVVAWWIKRRKAKAIAGTGLASGAPPPAAAEAVRHRPLRSAVLDSDSLYLCSRHASPSIIDAGELWARSYSRDRWPVPVLFGEDPVHVIPVSPPFEAATDLKATWRPIVVMDLGEGEFAADTSSEIPPGPPNLPTQNMPALVENVRELLRDHPLEYDGKSTSDGALGYFLAPNAAFLGRIDDPTWFLRMVRDQAEKFGDASRMTKATEPGDVERVLPFDFADDAANL